METQQQLSIFGEQCWGETDLEWQVLERDPKPHTTESALEYIERYTGKLPAETILIPVQVLCVPGTPWFLMPLLEETTDEPETN
jgi:hypothetical protein